MDAFFIQVDAQLHIYKTAAVVRLRMHRCYGLSLVRYTGNPAILRERGGTTVLAFSSFFRLYQFTLV